MGYADLTPPSLPRRIRPISRLLKEHSAQKEKSLKTFFGKFPKNIPKKVFCCKTLSCMVK